LPVKPPRGEGGRFLGNSAGEKSARRCGISIQTTLRFPNRGEKIRRVSYEGQFGDHVEDNAVKGDVTRLF
jgi:hypothetical protein